MDVLALKIELQKYLASDSYKENQKKVASEEIERKRLVQDFSIINLPTITEDDYVSGKKDPITGNPANLDSFCNRVENKLTWMGSMGLPYVHFFGIGYANGNIAYFRRRGGKQVFNDFNDLRQELIDLLNDAKNINKNIASVKKNRLFSTFKNKILFLYYPNDFFPVYGKEHLNKYCDILEIPHGQHQLDNNLKIVHFRKTHFPKLSNIEFCDFIYNRFNIDFFKKTPKKTKKQILAQAKTMVKQSFTNLADLPQAISTGVAGNKKGKSNFLAKALNQKNIGDYAEELVYEYEKMQLKGLGKEPVWIADENDRLGYDVLSYFANGIEKYIEVKAKSDGNLNNIEFFISKNEYHKLDTDSRFVIYYVYNLDKPQANYIEITKADLVNTTKIPVSFKYKLKAF